MILMPRDLLYWWHKPNAIEGRFDRTAQLKEAYKVSVEKTLQLKLHEHEGQDKN